MHPMQQLFGTAIPMFANVAILFYICRRFFAATKLRRRIMAEIEEFTSIVRRARDNVQYIGEQVAKGMEEIKGDVGEELRVTDRLTTQSSKLATVLQRFATLEENVIELVRMDRNRESVRIETPEDVNEEIRRILTAAERRKHEKRQQSMERDGAEAETGSTTAQSRRSTRDSAQRNPLSKFSACSPREVVFATRKSVDDRPRTPTMPEVRLLGESNRPVAAREDSKRES